jgi:hypothetical protein
MPRLPTERTAARRVFPGSDGVKTGLKRTEIAQRTFDVNVPVAAVRGQRTRFEDRGATEGR